MERQDESTPSGCGMDTRGRESRRGLFPGRRFGGREILAVLLLFAAVLVISNQAVRLVCERVVSFDCPTYWPLSMFRPRLPHWKHVITAVAVTALFSFSLKTFAKTGYRLPFVMLTGLLLILGTNVIQGWNGGFVSPIAHGGVNGVQYYHDAIDIQSPVRFIGRYEQLQPVLHRHSRTHPPGAVLTIFALLRLFGNPAAISISLAVVSGLLSMLFFSRILSGFFPQSDHPARMTFLLILIPSVQIYYAASLDALIAGLFLGVLYFTLHAGRITGIAGSAVFLFLSSFLTFAWIFMMPIMVGSEILMRKSIARTCTVSLILLIVYVIISRATGFDYFHSFLIASALENPQGFMLVSEPVSYLFTRIEGIFEILVFLGPFLGILAVAGVRAMRGTRTPLLTLFWLAIGSLLAMLAAGSFRTGETARVCLFVYPYLLLPVAWYMKHSDTMIAENFMLCSLVFGQSVLMQMFGVYFW